MRLQQILLGKWESKAACTAQSAPSRPLPGSEALLTVPRLSRPDPCPGWGTVGPLKDRLLNGEPEQSDPQGNHTQEVHSS